MDRFASPGGYTCASTGRIHAVCDEHGSHSFKSDGLPAHRPWMYEVMSTRRQKISGKNSETINIWIHVEFFHAHGVGSVHTAFLVLLDPSCQTDDTNLILRIATGSDRSYPSSWQRMTMYARHVYISVQLLVSWLHFIIVSVSVLTVSAVQIQMMDCLNEGWSLHTMYICSFCVWLNPVKVCGSVLVWNTNTTFIFLAVSTDPPRMDYWWSLKERAL